jgi:hypothetical protein
MENAKTLQNNRHRSTLKLVLLFIILFFTSRIAFSIVGYCSTLNNSIKDSKIIHSENKLLDVWGNWDTGWYLDIAQNWYSTQPHPIDIGGTTVLQANYVFYPLFPILIRLFSFVFTDKYVSALIVANISLAISAYLLYKISLLDYSKSQSLAITAYLFIFPSSVFLSMPLAESLFLALILAAIYFVRQKRWLAAGIAGFFAATTKPTGVFIFLPLAYEYLSQKKFNLSSIRRDIFYFILIPLGTLLYNIYLYLLTGDIFAFFKMDYSGWAIKPSNPFYVFYRMLFLPDLGIVKVFKLLLLLFIAAIILTIFLARKTIKMSYLVFSIIFILFPLFTGTGRIQSMPRYVSVVFPLVQIIGSRLSGNFRSCLTLAISTALCILFMVFWSNSVVIL